jgi:zinc transport system substrate-binding protein
MVPLHPFPAWFAPKAWIAAAAMLAAAVCCLGQAAGAAQPSEGPGEAPAPAVVTTIKPVHGLVSAVMEGVGTPGLLIPGGDDPHTHALRPSEARMMEQAQVVFWIGPTMEVSFARPLRSLPNARVVALMDAPGVRLLPFRGTEEHDDGAAGPGAGQAQDEAHGGADPHIWLDPDNAIAMAREIASVLGEVDPAHRARYDRNAADLTNRLRSLDAELRGILRPVADRPFITFHDAFQYFEHHYGLRSVASVTTSPERAPGARWVMELRGLVRAESVACIFVEPQFEPTLAKTIAEGSSARIATLDDLGAGIPEGPGFYEALMRAIAENLRGCLGNGSSG